MVEVEGSQARQLEQMIAAMNQLADQVAHLALTVRQQLELLDERLARIETRRTPAEQWEPRVRPYDVDHTCTCSAGWVIVDDVAHRCETCQGVTGE